MKQPNVTEDWSQQLVEDGQRIDNKINPSLRQSISAQLASVRPNSVTNERKSAPPFWSIALPSGALAMGLVLSLSWLASKSQPNGISNPASLVESTGVAATHESTFKVNQAQQPLVASVVLTNEYQAIQNDFQRLKNDLVSL
ncbi:MAG: hypothetical protein HWE13_07850 [Gammaproteobacteria bacterium]|nr:hypothetical protein [Gammaproteobacteria bacterium]